MRTVSALAGHPRIHRVALVDQDLPASWGHRVVRVEDTAGFEVVIEPVPGDDAIAVNTGEGAGITHASPLGLARALAAIIGRPRAMPVITQAARGPASKRSKGTVETVWLPPPIGRVLATVDADGVGTIPVTGPLAAAGAISAGLTRAVVDDRLYLEAICLAAAALIVDPAPLKPTPVWQRSESYILAAEELGLVVVEAVNGGP